MNKSRLRKLEQHAAHAPCPVCAPRQIEIIERDASEIESNEGGNTCPQCGGQLPITQIVAVRPKAA
jgi:C4-type Zn-finger protein